MYSVVYNLVLITMLMIIMAIGIILCDVLSSVCSITLYSQRAERCGLVALWHTILQVDIVFPVKKLIAVIHILILNVFLSHRSEILF